MDTLFEMLEHTKLINDRSRMESGLLSTFHDDHFDGDYSRYDSHLDLWSDGNDVMGLQLSETLNGILPIAPNEDASHFFETELEHRIPHPIDVVDDDLKETITEMDKVDEEDEEGYILANFDVVVDDDIEIISVDPNCEFSSPITVGDDDDDDDEDTESEETDSDRCSSRSSECSSSNSNLMSMCDYESDVQDAAVLNNLKENSRKSSPELITNQGPLKINVDTNCDVISIPTNITFKNTNGVDLSSNEFNHSPTSFISDTQKPCHEDVDIKNFDLAAYITQDCYDFSESKIDKLLLSDDKQHSHNSNTISKSSDNLVSLDDIKIESKCDSDTEAIIDIETVHDNEDDIKPMLLRKQTIDYSQCVDLNESFTQCDDDTKHDPSWSPHNEKTTKSVKPKNGRQAKGKKNNNLINQCNRMLTNSFVPTNQSAKSNAIMDRKKYGLGKGKNISMCIKQISDSSNSDSENKSNVHCKSKETRNIIQNCAISSDINLQKNNIVVIPSNVTELSLKTSENVKSISPKIETIVEIKEESKLSDGSKSQSRTENNSPGCQNVGAGKVSAEQNNSQAPPVVPVKKKLNLEEYKRRRENQLIGDTKIKKCIPYNPTNMQQVPAVDVKREETDQIKASSQSSVTSATDHKGQTKAIKSSSYPTNIAQKQGKGFYDPILEAKNKVLRMQELKKAAQSKRIDSTVSAKVGPITPILPLEQICNGNYKPQNTSAAKLNPEYEEIIIVSASCNTEVTLSPVFEKLDSKQTSECQNNPMTAVIKSSSLLSNINDTIKKTNTVKIPSNSLLSSIQDVVLKQSTTSLLAGSQICQKSPNLGVSPPNQFSPEKPEMSHTDQNTAVNTAASNNEHSNRNEHGEDKIIMHLRKDRIRKKTFSISTQTEDLPQFPPLTLLLAENPSSSDCSSAKKRKRRYRSRRNSSASSDDDDYRGASRGHVRYRSVSSHGTNRSISPRSSRYSYSNNRRTVSPYHKIRRRSSRSSSRTKYASDSSSDLEAANRRSRSLERRTRRYSSSHSSSSSNSSSDSSSRSRSRSRTPRSRSRSRSGSRYSGGTRQINLGVLRHSSPVEERRIVYVGRIERETSKEDLKRKFCAYGPIRQITVHYKDTGMKYGFVTFEKAQDAYSVIDGGLKDSRINMYDISFGGRRAFCRATYSDLDGAATNTLQNLPYPIAPPRSVPSFQEDSFESLLAKVKEKISSTKQSSTPSSRCKT